MNYVQNVECHKAPLLVKGLSGLMPAATRDRLARISTVQDIPANRIIWEADSAPGFVGFLISGYLRLQRHGREGHRQILSLLVPGDLVGENPGRVSGYTLESSTEVRLCRFESRAFEQLLLEDPSLRRAVHKLCIAKREQLRWLTWSLGALNTEERLCAFLAIATSHMPFELMADGTGVLTVDLPRPDMADLLGTSVESISRITNRLDATGVLKILSARQFRILDMPELIRMGCQQGTFGKIEFPGSFAARESQSEAHAAAIAARLAPDAEATQRRLRETAVLARAIRRRKLTAPTAH